MIRAQIADWCAETWNNGSFWRDIVVMWLGLLLGVFLPGLVAWLLKTRQNRKDEARKAKNVRRVLIDGHVRNLAAVRKMREILKQKRRSPELRLELGYLGVAMLPAAEVLEENPEEFGTLLNLKMFMDHVNRMLEHLMDMERQNFELESKGFQHNLEPYLTRLLGTEAEKGRLMLVEKMLEASLVFLDRGTKLPPGAPPLPITDPSGTRML